MVRPEHSPETVTLRLSLTDLSYSDDELEHLIHDSPPIAPISRVFLLSASLLAKNYEPHLVEDTVRAMDVARELGVRVPCVKRTVKCEANTYCIMERIKGRSMGGVELVFYDTVGSSASPFHQTSKVGDFVYRRISSNRRVQVILAGGPLWTTCKVDFRSRHVFHKFWVGFVSIRQAKKAAAEGAGHPKGRVPPTVKTFVFTHHDLAPRNILLDSSGQLWLLDWDYAGFYPSYFEYASMQNFSSLGTGLCLHDYGGIYSLGSWLAALSEPRVCYNG